MNLSSTPGQGSLFRIRLFLPHIHAAQATPAPILGERVGYIGPRRRILVVDNERVDRELLVGLLGALGFEMDQAASGLECLEVVPRFQPQLIFMDLAMPGIDGWETIRRLRRDGLSDARIAIISANAFDKGLDNDAGIPSQDFITKPVRIDDLLEWIGRALAIEWVVAEFRPTAAAVPAAHLPAADDLRVLDQLAGMGYLRGLLDKLNEIDALDAGHGEFVARLRQLAKQFEFDAIRNILSESPDESP
jgi:CheY-like chemotaxis protein